MLAVPSSRTGSAIGYLLTAAQALDGQRARLLAVLASVRDPRARRGVRHRLAVIFKPGGVHSPGRRRSFTAIAEWAADADRGTPGRARDHWRGAVRVHIPADPAEPRC